MFETNFFDFDLTNALDMLYRMNRDKNMVHIAKTKQPKR